MPDPIGVVSLVASLVISNHLMNRVFNSDRLWCREVEWRCIQFGGWLLRWYRRVTKGGK